MFHLCLNKRKILNKLFKAVLYLSVSGHRSLKGIGLQEHVHMRNLSLPVQQRMTSQDTITGRRAVLGHKCSGCVFSFCIFLFWWAGDRVTQRYLCCAKKAPIYYVNKLELGSRTHLQPFRTFNTMVLRPYCGFCGGAVFPQNQVISSAQVFQWKCIPSQNADNDLLSCFICCIW